MSYTQSRCRCNRNGAQSLTIFLHKEDKTKKQLTEIKFQKFTAGSEDENLKMGEDTLIYNVEWKERGLQTRAT
jgi:uncharacterized lipoprotein YehR (DUF1307 family)